MRRGRNIILGLLVVAVGCIWGLNRAGITNINIFFDGFWTLLIIVPCFLGLFSKGDKVGHIVGLLLGIFLLLTCQDLFGDISVWNIIVPAIVVAIGLKLVLSAIFPPHRPRLQMADPNVKVHRAVFGGEEIRFNNEMFQGCTLSALFGGIDMDLRHATITEDQVVEASAIFGGVDLLLPDNVNIRVNSTSICGGVDSKKHINPGPDYPTIYLNATCIFGGIEVK